ncbi:MAG: thioredoxin [Acidobacteriia bacterium]|nr:thioredoxin [Terriglobia bacterium]
MPNIVHIQGDNWQEVLASPKPVLVDFWAAWCAPCRALAPAFERLAAKYANDFGFAKVDVDELPELAGQLGIRSIPTLLLLQGGKVIDQVVGLQSYERLASLLDRHAPVVVRN